MPVITARNIDLTFPTADGPVHALKGVDLTINAGDFVSFIGPSGCGKTTFLRCIAALEHPTGGSLTVTHSGALPKDAVARQVSKLGYGVRPAEDDGEARPEQGHGGKSLHPRGEEEAGEPWWRSKRALPTIALIVSSSCG